MKTKMLIILEYERGTLMQRDILDGILESGAGRLSLFYYASVSPPYDKHSKTFRDSESFCRWLLRECVIRHDSPVYLDEYLHAMVDEWYDIGGSFGRRKKMEEGNRTDRRKCMTVAWDEIIKFNDQYFPERHRSPEVFYSNALAGEVGEVCNTTKHRAGGGTNKSEPSDNELMDEIADVFIYLQMLVEKMGLDVTSLSDAIHTKVQTNITRMNENNLEGAIRWMWIGLSDAAIESMAKGGRKNEKRRNNRKAR